MDQFHPSRGIVRAKARAECRTRSHRPGGIGSKCLAGLLVFSSLGAGSAPRAASTPLTMLDPNLQATTVINAGLSQPIGIVFLGNDDFLVLEKASGQVKRVIGGVLQPNPVLDLAVNSNSERGLLSL